MLNETLAQKLDTTREEMIELLNEDLADEYQAVITYTIYSQTIKGAAYTHMAEELTKHAKEELGHALKLSRQIDYFGGVPTSVPKPVNAVTDAEDILRLALVHEHEAVSHYTQRIRQAEAMGEYALAQTLREIVVDEQEHEIDLATALGIEVPRHDHESTVTRF